MWKLGTIRARWLVLGLVIATGLGFRAERMASEPLWVDEAESSINALTILSCGVPVDHYMGMPIYENVMIKPWPESAEYEFRDISYSDCGVAVYHGWLPLYSIAASQWLFGLVPDKEVAPPRVLHDESTLVRRTWVPRIPSLLFSGVMMLLMFDLARSMSGPAAGWAALVFVAFCDQLVWFGFQARYYSATLCMDALCAWALWRCIRHGRYRDFGIFGSALVLLFHTHTLSCAAVLATAFAVTPFMRRQPQLAMKIGMAAGIFTIGCLPWMWLSGLLEHASDLPAARDLLKVPEDIVFFTAQRWDAALLILMTLTCCGVAWWVHQRTGKVSVEAFARAKQATMLCGIWLVIAYASFFLLMPAASFYWVRMSMTLEVPAVLLISCGLGTAVQLLTRRFASATTVLIVGLFLICSGRLVQLRDRQEDPFQTWQEISAALRDQKWDSEVKFYAAPNFHLLGTYYTGIPIQSIAAVRKSFLDNYPGRIVLLLPHFLLDSVELKREVAAAATLAGRDPTKQELQTWQRIVNRSLLHARMQPRVRTIEAAPVVPPFLLPAIEAAHRLLASKTTPAWVIAECPVMIRDRQISTFEEWWVHYFYRFVDPTSRLGDQANFAQRLRTGSMKFVSNGVSLTEIPRLDATNLSVPESK